MSGENGVGEDKKEVKVLLAVIVKADGKMEWQSQLDPFRLNMLLDELKMEVIALSKKKAQEQADELSGPVKVKDETVD